MISRQISAVQASAMLRHPRCSIPALLKVALLQHFEADRCSKNGSSTTALIAVRSMKCDTTSLMSTSDPNDARQSKSPCPISSQNSGPPSSSCSTLVVTLASVSDVRLVEAPTELCTKSYALQMSTRSLRYPTLKLLRLLRQTEVCVED